MDTGEDSPTKHMHVKKDFIDDERRQIRREQILKRGSIPEFIQVTEMYQIYSAFVQVNLKNRLLLESSATAGGANPAAISD